MTGQGHYLPGYYSLTAGGPVSETTTPTTTPPGTVPVDRPNPLKTLTLLLAPAMAAVSAILTYLVTQGLVSQTVADTVNALGGSVVTSVSNSNGTSAWAAIVPALLAAAGTLTTSLLHTSLAKRKVTPTQDPRDDDGTKLVRVDSPLLALRRGQDAERTAEQSGLAAPYSDRGRGRHGGSETGK